MVVKILTRFGYERKRTPTSVRATSSPTTMGKTHPHLFMFQELENDVPEIFKIHLFLRPGLVRR